MIIDRMIAYYSPWNPVPSGISDYSEDLVPHLAQALPLALVRDDGAEPANTALDFVPASRLLDPATAADYELAIYQMGNNHHHEGIYRTALQRPGLVVLHDFVLHHLLVELTLARGDSQGFFDEMQYAHGNLGFDAALARVRGIESPVTPFAFPANKRVIDSALGVVVHSEWARREVAAASPEIPVWHVPMGIPAPVQPPGREEARRRLGIAPGAFLVGCFGFITPIKRAEALLEAAAAALPAVPNLELVVVGSVSPAVPLAARLAELGLASRTRVTGHVDFADFMAYIAACDVCVNLRYPSAGETSASLLRIMGMGLPVVVSEYRQFRELPAGTAERVPVGEAEVPRLAQLLAELAGDPPRRSRIAAAAREWVGRELTMERAVAGYVAAVEAVRGSRRQVSPRPSADVQATSSVPDVLAWRCAIEAPAVLPVGARFEARWRIENAGNTRWRGTPTAWGDNVVVAPRLWRLTAGARELAAEPAWQPLGRDVRPGQTFTGAASFRLPPQEGEYELEIDLVIPALGRFAELGAEPARHRVGTAA